MLNDKGEGRCGSARSSFTRSTSRSRRRCAGRAASRTDGPAASSGCGPTTAWRGIGETQGGEPTLVQLRAIQEYFLGEDPFDLEHILKKTWWVPFYHGTTGRLAISGLEMCCWDLMGKAAGRPVCQLLGGKLRTEIPFAAYIFYRHRAADGRGGETTPEEIVEHTRDLVTRYGFASIKLKGGVLQPEAKRRPPCATPSPSTSCVSTPTRCGRSRRRSGWGRNSRRSSSSTTRTRCGGSRG